MKYDVSVTFNIEGDSVDDAACRITTLLNTKFYRIDTIRVKDVSKLTLPNRLRSFLNERVKHYANSCYLFTCLNDAQNSVTFSSEDEKRRVIELLQHLIKITGGSIDAKEFLV
jgi:hypothetical protein